MIKIDPKSMTAWLPLMIVAGYFLFLIATWMKYSSVMRTVVIKQEGQSDKPVGNDSDI